MRGRCGVLAPALLRLRLISSCWASGTGLLDRLRVLAFKFRLDGQELFTPGLAIAFRAFFNNAADCKTVIALLAAVTGELLALAAALDLALHLRSAVLFIQHVFAGNAHGLLLTRNTLPQNPWCCRAPYPLRL